LSASGFQPIQTNDSILTRIQANISSAFQQIKIALFGGQTVTATFSATFTDTLVTHNLGSGAGVSFLVGSSSTAGAVPFISATKSPSPSQTIYLQLVTQSSGTSTTATTLTTPVTVTMYFFNNQS
jgi:hypothetical protein